MTATTPSSPRRMRPTRTFYRHVLAVGTSLLLLGYIANRVGLERIVERLNALDPLWICVGLSITIGQYALSAYRWQMASSALGLRLRLGTAISQYYASGLLNATLPSGIAGEGLRVWVQGRSNAEASSEPAGDARDSPGLGRALLAVSSERVAGQVTFGILAASGAVAASALHPEVSELGMTAIAAVAFSVVAVVVVSTASRFAFADDESRPRIPWIKLVAISLPVTLTYVGVYICVLLALDLDISVSIVTIAIPLTLLAMSLPISVGGFGPRETAALFIWGALGHTPEEGAIGALVYGLVCLAATLPGLVAIALFAIRRKGT